MMLGLSFDPIEEDENIIKKAIEDKSLEWQKEAKNPRKQVIAREKLAKVPDMKRVMLDSKLRQEEAQKALSIKRGYEKDLKNELFIIQTKGYITPTELKEIHNKYSYFGYSEENIKEMLTTSVEVAPIQELPDDAKILDNKIVSQLTTYFSNLAKDDYSLYNYLCVDKNDGKEKVISRTNEEIKRILEKGSKSNTDEVEQKLLGLCNTIFSNDETITAYNNYLSGCQYRKINELIQTGIKMNNSMTENLFQGLIKICVDDYSMTEKYAVAYIINNIKINKYNIDIASIRDMSTTGVKTQQSTLSKEEEKELIRERILEEQKIKEQIEEEKRMEEEEREKKRREEEKFKEQYKEVVDKVFSNIKEQEEFIIEKNNFMEEHSNKRIKNGAVPSKGMSYVLITLFVISLIIGGYSLINPNNLELGDLALVPLACVGVCFLVGALYFYINKMWQNCQDYEDCCIILSEKFDEAKNKTIEVSKEYEVFTEDAREALIECETKNGGIVKKFVENYNNYIKYNNRAKFRPWMTKLIFVSLAANAIMVLLQLFGDKL